MYIPQLSNEEKLDFLRSALFGGDAFVKDGVQMTDGVKQDVFTPLDINNMIAVLINGEAV